VHSQYGWHIIQALGPVKTTPLSQVEQQIHDSLLSTKKKKTMTSWVDALKKEFSSKISYQSGYAPTATTSTSTTSTTG
jgi:parvulin-like peptidyl-prolyl isomerase